jgi:hypothetical protein
MVVYFKGNGQGLLDSLFIPARKSLSAAGVDKARFY